MNDEQLLPKLRHERWMGWMEVPGRALLEIPVPGLPRVCVGEDTPRRFNFVQQANLNERPFADFEAVAVANLARRPASWAIKAKSGGVFGFGGKPSRLELIDEFACERILDVAFMKQAHALLASPLIVVAIPVRGILRVASATADAAATGELVEFARSGFIHVLDGMEPITPHALTIQDGAIVGIVQNMRGTTPDLDREDVEPAAGFPWPVQPVPDDGARRDRHA
jgi:hypothetical protein